jgi:hypothetical protein
MRKFRRLLLFLAPVAFAAGGCTTLPDVKPFADSTAALAAAAGTHYHEVSNDLASLQPPRVPGESEASFATRQKSLEDAQKTFTSTGQSLDALFDAMTTYSEKVANLAAAGKTGPDAAQSLLDSTKGFVQLAGISVPAAGAALDAVTKGFKAIADEFTRLQAKKSLKDAVEAAQPGVDLVATQFAVIFGVAMTEASGGIRNAKRLQASIAAGPSVIGFNDNVLRNYNAYYQYLNSLVTDAPPGAPDVAWRGFCRDRVVPCRAVSELDAVGLVEARMTAIHPIVDAYSMQIHAIDDTLELRRKRSDAVIRAVKSWAVEHQKLRQSLEDGTALSAFNLKAALVELQGLLGDHP